MKRAQAALLIFPLAVITRTTYYKLLATMHMHGPARQEALPKLEAEYQRLIRNIGGLEQRRLAPLPLNATSTERLQREAIPSSIYAHQAKLKIIDNVIERVKNLKDEKIDDIAVDSALKMPPN
jgi:hypothetical protein